MTLPSADPGAAGAAAPAPEPPNNVPAALSSLVGRAADVAAVGRALAHARLLTLNGPGGAGKTRLAREVAAAAVAARAHPGGVWWAELAPVSAGADVAATVAATLGVILPPGRPAADVIAEALQGPPAGGGAPRQVLVVLDNCEHVVDDVAELADRLLRAAPGLALLATSREALGIEGEVAWPVPPLARPTLADAARAAHTPADPAALAEYEAVQLFAERARAVVPGFALTAGNAAAVASIAARLDGLPLALELAAAALPALGVEALAARLDDALGLLTRGRRTALPRHRTLRAVLEWSYRLLADDERALLRRLSVFRGAFTLDAIEAVCARPAGDAGAPGDAAAGPPRDLVPALGRLVEHALVEVRDDAGETRYRLLETVRQFGAALLQGTPDEHETRARHARWVARVAAEAEPLLFSPARGRTVERLRRDVDEIRAALAWAARLEDGRPAGEPMTAVRIAGALGWFWFSGVPWEEARALLAATLAAADAEGVPDADRPLADRVAFGTFIYPLTGQHYFAGDTAGMLALTARELRLWDTVEAAGAAHPGALAPAQRLAMARGRSLAHQLRALALGMRGDCGAALPEMARSVAAAEAGGDAHGDASGDACGDPWLAAVMVMRQALVHLVCGDPAAADAAYRAAIPRLRAIGEWWFLSLTYEGMAAGALLTGDLAGGVRDGRLSVQVLRADRDEWFASRGLDTLAALLTAAPAAVPAAADARPDDALAATAARLLGAAEALRRRTGALVIGPDQERQAGVVAALRARLGEDAYAAAHAVGAAMSLDDVFAFVDDGGPLAELAARGALPGAAGAPVPPAPGGPAPARAADGAPAPSTASAGGAPTGRAEAASTLRLDVLGPFRMAADGAPLPPDATPTGKARELLLWLLLHEQGTKEEIALALWPDASAARVRNLFHVTLHHLRRQLADPRWIAHERGAYRLARRPAAGLALDADLDAVLDAGARLRAAARRATGAVTPPASGSPGGPDAPDFPPVHTGSRRDPAPDSAAPGSAAPASAALDDLHAALERRRGDLAEDAAVGEWIVPHRGRVHATWADAVEALAERFAAAGRHDDARAACARLLAEEPLRESAHRQLMAALAALGDAGGAVAHYEELARRLQRELGARPSRETQALAERLSVPPSSPNRRT